MPDISELKAAPAPTLKLKRPSLKEFTETAKEDIDDRIFTVSEPDKEFNADDLLRIAADSTEDMLHFAERTIATIEWGDFDVDVLIDLLQKLRKVITGITLYEGYQEPVERRIYRSALVNDGEEITAIFSRQSGKTEIVSCVVPTLCFVMPALAKVFPDQLSMYSNGFWVGVYAPGGQQADTLFNRIVSRATSESAKSIMSDPDFNIFPVAGTRWSNGSLVFRQSADPRARVESKTYHLLIGEEAQDLEYRVIEKSLVPMLAATNGTFLLIGTSKDRKCYFYDSIMRNKVDDIRHPSDKKHFEYDYQIVQKYNPRYAAHVQKQINKYGAQSPYFLMSYCNKWLLEEGMAVTEHIFKEYTMLSTYGVVRGTDNAVVVGIDQARKVNRTIVTVGEITTTQIDYEDDEEPEKKYSVRIVGWLELNRVSWPMQRKLINEYLDNFTDIRMIAMDTTGAGDVQFQDFEQEFPDLPMMGYVFSGKSKEQLANLFYEYLYTKRLQIPTTKEARRTKEWQAFWLEWTSVQKVTKNGFTYFCKDEQVGASDDYVDSSLLMLAALEAAIKDGGTDVEGSADLIFREPKSLTSPSKNFEAIRRKYRSGQGHISPRQARYNKLLKGMLA